MRNNKLLREALKNSEFSQWVRNFLTQQEDWIWAEELKIIKENEKLDKPGKNYDMR